MENKVYKSNLALTFTSAAERNAFVQLSQQPQTAEQLTRLIAFCRDHQISPDELCEDHIRLQELRRLEQSLKELCRSPAALGLVQGALQQLLGGVKPGNAAISAEQGAVLTAPAEPADADLPAAEPDAAAKAQRSGDKTEPDAPDAAAAGAVTDAEPHYLVTRNALKWSSLSGRQKLLRLLTLGCWHPRLVKGLKARDYVRINPAEPADCRPLFPEEYAKYGLKAKGKKARQRKPKRGKDYDQV